MRSATSSSRSSFSRAWALFGFGLVLSCAPSPAYSQSAQFEPDKTYSVSGAELNSLQAELQLAKNQLADLRSKNEELQKDSASKQQALTALQTQLTQVSSSFKASQNEALATEVKVVVTVALAALATGYVLHR
jgi:peptidoglycan hydrolase CwlO-like protein